MHIAVFGANGRTGRLVVDEALAGGHHVRAYVRDAARLPAGRPGLTVHEGQVDDPAAIKAAITGADAVISALGSGGGTLTRFAEALIPQMQAAGVSRVVSLIGAGVSEPGDPGSLGRTAMLTLMRLLAGGVLKDAEAHAKLLRASPLRYTLVRPPRLTEGPATGRLQSAPSLALGPGHSISRADLAAFMLECALADSFVRQSPMVASL